MRDNEMCVCVQYFGLVRRNTYILERKFDRSMFVEVKWNEELRNEEEDKRWLTSAIVELVVAEEMDVSSDLLDRRQIQLAAEEDYKQRTTSADFSSPFLFSLFLFFSVVVVVFRAEK